MLCRNTRKAQVPQDGLAWSPEQTGEEKSGVDLFAAATLTKVLAKVKTEELDRGQPTSAGPWGLCTDARWVLLPKNSRPLSRTCLSLPGDNSPPTKQQLQAHPELERPTEDFKRAQEVEKGQTQTT